MIKLKGDEISEEYLTFGITLESLMKQLAEKVTVSLFVGKDSSLHITYKERKIE